MDIIVHYIGIISFPILSFHIISIHIYVCIDDCMCTVLWIFFHVCLIRPCRRAPSSMPWWGTSKMPWTRRRCRPRRCSSWGECCCGTRCWRRRCTSVLSHGRRFKSAGGPGGAGGKTSGISRNSGKSMKFYHVWPTITQLVLRMRLGRRWRWGDGLEVTTCSSYSKNLKEATILYVFHYIQIWLVVWNIFYFTSYWEWSSQLTNISQRVETTNQMYVKNHNSHVQLQCAVSWVSPRGHHRQDYDHRVGQTNFTAVRPNLCGFHVGLSTWTKGSSTSHLWSKLMVEPDGSR